ncbi:granulocyte colony-stimulating factor-like [Trachinotus anak]|uniref:granulocyte colony-stimulating factor-like n=1 Tax=Trachinotus anak TaxID=443729 RepID=UPI0039F21CB1
MNTLTVAALLHCFLFAVLVQSAPVSLVLDPPPAFREAAERAKTLVEKILRDLPAVHAATVTTEGLTFDPSTQTTNLQMMVRSLGIPASPVIKPLSERFTLDMCVSRMSAGSRLYQGLLGVLSEKLGRLTDLQADLRDLLTHISKMKETAQLGGDSSDQNPNLDLSSHLSSYEVQVAVHVTLTQLRSFCHDLIRSLRVIARTAGAR